VTFCGWLSLGIIFSTFIHILVVFDCQITFHFSDIPHFIFPFIGQSFKLFQLFFLHIVHYLHCLHCLSVLGPTPPYIKQKRFFSFVSYRYMKSINHILSPYLLQLFSVVTNASVNIYANFYVNTFSVFLGTYLEVELLGSHATSMFNMFSKMTIAFYIHNSNT
jgi:hypothetical protein